MNKFTAPSQQNLEKLYRTSAADILLLIRDGIATDWSSLCNLLNVAPNNATTPGVHLNGYLQSLVEAKVIECHFTDSIESSEEFSPSSLRDSFPMHGASFKVTTEWTSIQHALNFSLRDLSKLSKSKSIIVTPAFTIEHVQQDNSQVFVIMPFADRLQPVFSDHIKKVADDVGVTVTRADDFFKSGSIITDIFNALYSARVVIADCTGRNPNVIYELGIAHALGRPVIIITQEMDDVPFDIRHLRCIEYEFTPRGMIDFEHTLSKSLRHELETESS